MHTQQEKDDFLGLITANRGIIIKVCNSYCYNKSDREDLAQEIIYQLWRSNHRYDRDYRFSTWMYRVALNVAISHYRAGKKKDLLLPLMDTHLEIQDHLFDHPDPGDRSSLLHRKIRELKELDKALILLYFEEKSYKEIAEILGITETNVSTRISRIKEKLKESLTNTPTKK